jgi:hypothetical protein
MGGTRSHIETAAEGKLPRGEYDLFLSHATPDKPWILTLAERLEALGLRVFVDALEIDPGDNWVIRLNDALLLALPWELLHHDNRFLIREGQVDLLRITTTGTAGLTLLRGE